MYPHHREHAVCMFTGAVSHGRPSDTGKRVLLPTALGRSYFCTAMCMLPDSLMVVHNSRHSITRSCAFKSEGTMYVSWISVRCQNGKDCNLPPGPRARRAQRRRAPRRPRWAAPPAPPPPAPGCPPAPAAARARTGWRAGPRSLQPIRMSFRMSFTHTVYFMFSIFVKSIPSVPGVGTQLGPTAPCAMFQASSYSVASRY
jgi:hypothetical protein